MLDNLFSSRSSKKPPKRSTEPHLEKGDFVTLIEDSIENTLKADLIPNLEELERIGSITELVDVILKKAVQSRASDVHMDPQINFVILRFRIDGILYDIAILDKTLQPLIVSRVKVLAGLRTDEHYIPQDGRFHFSDEEAEIGVDLRISIVPTYFGENIVFRLLKGEADVPTLTELGFSKKDLEIIKRYMKKPHGMILATGPTGSGKTTTLYSIIHAIQSRKVSMVTIEDPIEYSLPGSTQIQVNTQTHFTFANGLRSIVRQDPNIILVGEIRDKETANIAVNAAMTGHQLLSSLHTIDAATTLPRLEDMGIEPFLIASSVNVIISQRLLRRLCEHCRVKKSLTAQEARALKQSLPKSVKSKLPRSKTFYQPKGCKRCNKSGYLGRIGIFEVMEITDGMRKLIMGSENADRLRDAAQSEGMTTIFEDGMRKASEGVTSIEEVLRVIQE